MGGAVSTSKLQIFLGDMLDRKFPEFRIRENYRPDWLISSDKTRLELDFYIEGLKIAFEVQGVQHYQYTPFFHRTYDDFEKRKQYDNEKRELCYGNGVRLIEIFTCTDAEVAVKDIEAEVRKPEEKYSYADERFSKSKIHGKWIKKFRKPSDLDPKDNSEEARIKRLEECKKKLEMYERGEIKREPNVVKAWREVVKNNGFASRQ